MFSLLTSTRRLNDRYKNIRKNQSAIYVISLDINYILFCKSAIVFNRKYYESPFYTYHDILKLNKQILINVKTYFSDKGLQIIAIYNTKKFLEEWNPQIISQVLRNPLVVTMKYMFPNIS